eukprot:scpid100022/ scgid24342/ UPF0510 protein INM02; Hematopoietic signal peptide-containing membrane domain-containing protein 1
MAATLLHVAIGLLSVPLSCLISCSEASSPQAAKKSPRDAEHLVHLEHNLGDGFSFIPKGHAVVKSVKAKSVPFSTAASTLSTSQVLAQLQVLAKADRPYIVRASVHIGWPVNETHSVFSFAPACWLVKSRLSEKLQVHVTNDGEVLGLTVQPMVPECAGLDAVKVQAPASFNSTVSLTQPQTGPSPDTAAYIQKIQREEEIRTRNPPDNRSFIQKYWMYILPFLFFMMLPSGQDGGGRGGGGGGGGS